MSDDLVAQLNDLNRCIRCDCGACVSGYENHEHICSGDKGCVAPLEPKLRKAIILAGRAATALTEARAEIERLRKVACDCATAIGNGAALSPESSLDFIELLPGEIAKHTDKLRRFLKCARDEGTEALDRADAAESELSTLRARAEKAESALAEAVEVLRPLVAP